MSAVRGGGDLALLQPRVAPARTIRAFQLALGHTMRILYHVTPPANIDSILRDGLIPQLGPRSAIVNETTPAVFCFADMEKVETALMNWLGDYFDEDEPLALLRVTLDSDALVGAGAAYEVVVLNPIPPEAVSVMLLDVWNQAAQLEEPEISFSQS